MQKHQYNEGEEQQPGCAHSQSSSFETHAVAFRSDSDTNSYNKQREAKLRCSKCLFASINGIRGGGNHAPGVSTV